MELKVLNVREYGKSEETREVTDIHGEKWEIKKGQTLYFVNNVFSDCNNGFLITAEGRICTQTKHCTLTIEEMTELAKQAVKKIAKGEMDNLGLHVTL